MSDLETVLVTVQTADRTRRAQVRVRRDMLVADLVKITRKKWFLGFGVDYQVTNLTTGQQLLSQDMLTIYNVKTGDTLVLQPMATHGGR